ncbi:MAG: hypothetical protein HY320_14395 [Armatimonadetes bacterium]|nr:hypothetical protein [Armatimonadota bacterium]
MVDPRVREAAAMAMIGDGMLGVLEPKRHCRVWEFGPKPYQEFIEWFVEHPQITRLLGALEVGLGLWLASRQTAPQVASRREVAGPVDFGESRSEEVGRMAA